MPKAISFDIWSTLVTPNPVPHPTGGRQVSIAEAYGVEANEALKRLVRDVSKELDRESEAGGVQYGCGDRVDLVADRLGMPRLSPEKRDALVAACQASTVSHPPVLIHPETPALLKELKDRGYKLAIISNTGYPEGTAMRQVLETLGILEHMDVTTFSNEAGHAKPAKEIYHKTYEALGVAPEDALHVGDSLPADYEGARAAGAQAILLDPEDAYGVEGSIRSLDELRDRLV